MTNNVGVTSKIKRLITFRFIDLKQILEGKNRKLSVVSAFMLKYIS